ncbi:metallophosphoesterase [Acidithiobacillus ferriphilus]|uniref:metallophosphoesterase n=1 Tax=Acidithiobacillus ferriphilus TaxID=1689834 RepID=UPI001C06F833|nr:metallophosphoesterase [Acidithiobacillus ferriphilus]MBU2852943.1 metallophosphoesterase [Acidithiobacillus ferriphilus]
MPQTWFTSDLHLGHKNIIQYCQRPFASVEEMDHALIRAWNDRVEANDTVYVLGDFAFESGVKARSALRQLAGRKILILGNHDRSNDWAGEGWAEVHEAKLIEVGHTRLYLHHYPLRDWPGKWQRTIHLYGHVHGRLEPVPGSMDVGVDSWGGAPVSLDEVCQSIQPFDPKSHVPSRHVEKEWR